MGGVACAAQDGVGLFPALALSESTASGTLTKIAAEFALVRLGRMARDSAGAK
ncbi:MAG TPA: hypothetical protein VMC41_01300 [Candidatus Nanoarchaeia archaeon]|nr:hypothetical protein [Candidatus Nanoarchaeia archaeon]